MALMDNIWVEQRTGRIVAVHPVQQAMPLGAYPDCDVYSVAAGTMSPVSIETDDTGLPQYVPTVLTPDQLSSLAAAFPVRVSKMGLRRALREADKLAAFDAALAKASDDDQDDYASGAVFSTDDPTILHLLDAVKIKNEARARLFRRAEALVV